MKTKTFHPAVIIIVGILCLAYPIVSTLWNNHEAKVVSQEYIGHVLNQSEEAKRAHIKAADDYNAARTGFKFVDPYQKKDLDKKESADYKKYLNTLADPKEAMGVVKIPKIGVNLPIYHGTSPETLQRGAGHLYGSDLPVGGINRHTVITAHTGLADITMFDQLTSIKKRDYFYLQVQGGTYKYQVIRTNVVRPEDISTLQRINGQDLATLLTCTPYGVNSHRLLVTVIRVLPDPISAPADSWQWSWWMLAFLAAIIVSLYIFYTVVRNKKKIVPVHEK